MALATAKQFARFVLELIVGIWSCFDVFFPTDVIKCHVYIQGKLGCLCCTLTIFVGIWSRFDVFVPTHICDIWRAIVIKVPLCCYTFVPCVRKR